MNNDIDVLRIIRAREKSPNDAFVVVRGWDATHMLYKYTVVQVADDTGVCEYYEKSTAQVVAGLLNTLLKTENQFKELLAATGQALKILSDRGPK